MAEKSEADKRYEILAEFNLVPSEPFFHSIKEFIAL